MGKVYDLPSKRAVEGITGRVPRQGKVGPAGTRHLPSWLGGRAGVKLAGVAGCVLFALVGFLNSSRANDSLIWVQDSFEEFRMGSLVA